jgi:hypothetical protein
VGFDLSVIGSVLNIAALVWHGRILTREVARSAGDRRLPHSGL